MMDGSSVLGLLLATPLKWMLSIPMLSLSLGISGATVAKHLDHIYRKLGVESRTAAAARALSPEPD
jgi:biotin operon repressor